MPEAITYRVTNPDLPGWVANSFADLRRGIAYEVDGFFVHFYGREDGLWHVNQGITITERANGPLQDWVTRLFGASDIEPLGRAAGHAVDGIWRPGLYFQDQVHQALGANRQEQRAAEQSLHLLVSALNDVFLYVEPEGPGLDAYGPKMRELLILACTEVEDVWTRFLRRAGRQPAAHGFTTNDYVALRDPLHLLEFSVSLLPYAAVPATRPFDGWDPAAPTRSLRWYDAYNRTKHDRSGQLSAATLGRCVEAVAANVVLYCTRFSPYALFHEATPLAALATHLFSLELVDCDPAEFYVPLIDPAGYAPGFGWTDSQRQTRAWTTDPLLV